MRRTAAVCCALVAAGVGGYRIGEAAGLDRPPELERVQVFEHPRERGTLCVGLMFEGGRVAVYCDASRLAGVSTWR